TRSGYDDGTGTSQRAVRRLGRMVLALAVGSESGGRHRPARPAAAGRTPRRRPPEIAGSPACRVWARSPTEAGDVCGEGASHLLRSMCPTRLTPWRELT